VDILKWLAKLLGLRQALLFVEGMVKKSHEAQLSRRADKNMGEREMMGELMPMRAMGTGKMRDIEKAERQRVETENKRVKKMCEVWLERLSGARDQALHV